MERTQLNEGSFLTSLHGLTCLRHEPLYPRLDHGDALLLLVQRHRLCALLHHVQLEVILKRRFEILNRSVFA